MISARKQKELCKSEFMKRSLIVNNLYNWRYSKNFISLRFTFTFISMIIVLAFTIVQYYAAETTFYRWDWFNY